MITLKTLPQATAQEVFDQVLAHGRAQQQHSEDTNGHYAASISQYFYQEGMREKIGRCLYRAPNGLKCFAGSLIADDEYQPYFENRRWDSLAEINEVPHDHKVLITELQKIHDLWGIEKWEERFQKVATDFDLIYKAA